MNAKEIAELRRRFRAEKNNIGDVCGVLVNGNKQIVSEFRQCIVGMPEDEASSILGMMRKALSGGIGRNLLDVSFSAGQVEKGEAYRALADLRESGLKDDEALHRFYQRAVPAIEAEGSYVLLLAADTYDVFSRHTDGEKEEDAGEQFRYIVCCVCPVKPSATALTYYPHENRLRNVSEDTILCPPELGFLFPAFDNRQTNLYGALYYTRDTGNSHTSFTDAVFDAPLPLPARTQKTAFNTVLAESLSDDCDYEVAQSLHREVCDMIETHKESKDPDPLVISRGTVKNILENSGIAGEKIAAFEQKFDEAFGKNAFLPPENLVEKNRFELETPDVVVKVDPARRDLVEVRVVDGVKYIMIRAEQGVVVNGLDVKI